MVGFGGLDGPLLPGTLSNKVGGFDRLPGFEGAVETPQTGDFRTDFFKNNKVRTSGVYSAPYDLAAGCTFGS